MEFKIQFRTKWFWFSVLTVVCWGAWATLSKLGSRDLSVQAMQFYYALGAVPVAFVLLGGRHFRLEKSFKGIFYGVANGLLSSLGNLAVVAAYQSGGNTAVITTVTALYPMVTVGLAILVLRERLTHTQIVGVCFAGAAMVILSF